MLTHHIILDAARMNEAMDTAKELNPNHKSLYRAGKGQDEILPAVAPFLFIYPHSQEFADFILQQGWGDAWGIFIDSGADFDTLWKHFRKFLTVQTEEGAQLYFRFYDPRVLRIFLPTCDTYQLKDFFGPVEQYVVEDENPEQAIVFSIKKGALESKTISKEALFPSLQYKTATTKSFWDSF